MLNAVEHGTMSGGITMEKMIQNNIAAGGAPAKSVVDEC